MKDQYFGDVNDYRKYGLLRCLVRHSGLSLGVCWFKTPPDLRRDGEFRRYLDEPGRWRRPDPDLYDRLQRLKDDGVRRSVAFADAWQLLPGAVYEESEVPRDAVARRAFFAGVLTTLGGCDLLFFDPDTGSTKCADVRARLSAPSLTIFSTAHVAFVLVPHRRHMDALAGAHQSVTTSWGDRIQPKIF